MITFGIYKPSKAKGLWKYYITRVFNHCEEHLTADLIWTTEPFQLHYWKSEDDVRKVLAFIEG